MELANAIAERLLSYLQTKLGNQYVEPIIEEFDTDGEITLHIYWPSKNVSLDIKMDGEIQFTYPDAAKILDYTIINGTENHDWFQEVMDRIIENWWKT